MRSLQRLRPDPTRKAILDTKIKGLHIVPGATKPGQGAFRVAYVVNGKQRKAKIGGFRARTPRKTGTVWMRMG
jgi:hypothetical protein